MAARILLLCAEFRGRPATFGVVEYRVVAEAAVASTLASDLSFPAPLRDQARAVVRRYVAGAAVERRVPIGIGDVAQLVQQLVDILVVRRIRPGAVEGIAVVEADFAEVERLIAALAEAL